MTREEICEKLDSRLDTIPPGISVNFDFTEDHFHQLKEIGGIWKYDEENVSWFFSPDRDPEQIDPKITTLIEESHSRNVYDDCEEAKRSIMIKMMEIDKREFKKEAVVKSYIKAMSDDKEVVRILKQYLPLLTDHQMCDYHFQINRWGFVTYAKDREETYWKVPHGMELAKSIYEVVDNPDKKVDLEIDWNIFAQRGWKATNAGLKEEAIYVWEAGKTFLSSIEEDLKKGREPTNLLFDFFYHGIKNGSSSHSPYLGRYTLSTNLALAKAYQLQGRIEEAKQVYIHCISLHPSGSALHPAVQKNPAPGVHVSYWSGFSRILEAAIEWYNLEESEEEKEKAKEIVLSIFFHQRNFAFCNEKTDATREALLNAYMILRDIYGEVQ
jgi:tetratricopeptide (TPR) repeat protein